MNAWLLALLFIALPLVGFAGFCLLNDHKTESVASAEDLHEADEARLSDAQCELLQRLVVWFESDLQQWPVSDEEAAEIFETRYGDSGQTMQLLTDLRLAASGNPTEADFDNLLGRCRAWFEMIDAEASGYASLGEALEEIYDDEGATRRLYLTLSAEVPSPI